MSVVTKTASLGDGRYLLAVSVRMPDQPQRTVPRLVTHRCAGCGNPCECLHGDAERLYCVGCEECQK